MILWDNDTVSDSNTLTFPPPTASRSHLKAGGCRLLGALVEVGHRLAVEVHPGVEVGIGGLLGPGSGGLT